MNIAKNFARNYEKKNNTWNIKCLVDESFVPATQRSSILYSRLSDFRFQSLWLARSIPKSESRHTKALWHLRLCLCLTVAKIASEMIVKIKEKKALLCFSTKRSLFLGGQKAPLNTYDQKSWCRERFRGKLYLEVNAY